MSYEDAVHKLRDADVAPPSFTDIEQRRRWKTQSKVPAKRVSIATVATLAAAIGYIVLTIRPVLWPLMPTVDDGSVALWRSSIATLLPAGLLGWVIVLMRRPGTGPQMLTRAVLWSNLVVSALIAGNFLASTDRGVGAAIAVACAVAILALGSKGLDSVAPGDSFAPVRFRGQLLLALVMAFADAQTLMFSAVLQLRVGMQGWNLAGTIAYAGPITIAALVMGVTVWGLYRLRTWALILNLVANIAIAYFALAGALNVAIPVAAALTMTAGVQMFLPVPIFAMALGEKRAGQPVLRGHAPKLLPVSVVAIALLAVTLAIQVTNPLGWLTGPGRAFLRGLEGRRMPPPQLNADFADWTGRGLGELELRNASLRSANLSRAFGGLSIDLTNADLTDATVRRVHFANADLAHATLVRTDFQWANLRGVDFTNAELIDTNLVGADLTGADMRWATASGLDLRGANLTGVRMDAFDGRYEGATCPDGEPADSSTGCAEHLGRIVKGDPNYSGTFRLVGQAWRGKGCANIESPLMIADDYVVFLNQSFVHVGDDEFINDIALLVIDRSKTPVVAKLMHNACGWAKFEALQAAP